MPLHGKIQRLCVLASPFGPEGTRTFRGILAAVGFSGF
jgi:hypothetical protein